MTMTNIPFDAADLVALLRFLPPNTPPTAAAILTALREGGDCNKGKPATASYLPQSHALSLSTKRRRNPLLLDAERRAVAAAAAPRPKY